MSYPYEYCDKIFKEKKYLAHHIKAVHLNSFIEKCNVGQQIFAGKKRFNKVKIYNITFIGHFLSFQNFLFWKLLYLVFFSCSKFVS